MRGNGRKTLEHQINASCNEICDGGGPALVGHVHDVKAGIHGLTFHDLRGSAVVRLALADATVPQIATFTGHSLRGVEAVLDAHYLGRDVKLAEIAMMKLETGTKL
jgi:integrase